MSYVQTTRFTGSGVTSVTSPAFGSNTTTGNAIIVTATTWSTTVPTTSATDSKSNSYSLDVSQADPGAAPSGGKANILSALNITGGASHTVTVTSSVSGAYIEANATEFSGVVTSSALDKTAGAQGSSSSTSLTATTVTTTQANELVVACLDLNGSSTNASISDPPSGYTSIGVNQDPNATIGYESAYKTVAATGTQSVTWTYVASNPGTGGVIATYKLASSGVSVNLGGQSVASTEGSVAPTVAYSPAGQAITSTLGTISAQVSYGLTGQSVISTEGALSAAWSGSATLAGQSVTSSLGAVGPEMDYALSGQSITSAEGALSSSQSILLTGQVIGSTEGIISANVAGNVTIQLGGLAATFGLGTISLGGLQPAGKHRKRYGLIDGDRLLIFDTRAQRETAKIAIASRELPKTKSRRVRLKPMPAAASVVPLAHIESLARAVGETQQYQTILRDTAPTRLTDFYEALQQHVRGKEEEDAAVALLHLDRMERQAHLQHLSELLEMLHHTLRRNSR